MDGAGDKIGGIEVGMVAPFVDGKWRLVAEIGGAGGEAAVVGEVGWAVEKKDRVGEAPGDQAEDVGNELWISEYALVDERTEEAAIADDVAAEVESRPHDFPPEGCAGGGKEAELLEWAAGLAIGEDGPDALCERCGAGFSDDEGTGQALGEETGQAGLSGTVVAFDGDEHWQTPRSEIVPRFRHLTNWSVVCKLGGKE